MNSNRRQRIPKQSPAVGDQSPKQLDSQATRSTLLSAGALVALVLVAYAPVALDGFIWDDDDNVTNNVTLRSADGLRRMWTEPLSIPQYYPLVHTTFWIEYHVWGLHPLGYHVVNVLLHATSALLLWRLLVRLRVPGAWLAAAIFAIHPVGVESVAWITERKNVLSLTLVLGSLLSYLRFAPLENADQGSDEAAQTQDWRWYALSFLLFALAMLSKTVVATMPAVVLVLCWWKRGRITRRDILPLVPYFALALALGLCTVWLERKHVGAEGAEWALSPVERVMLAGRDLWFYATKLAWPHPLMFFYERWRIDDQVWWQYLFPAAALVVIVSLWFARSRIGRGPLAAVLIFAGVLMPALGFFNVYPFLFSFVADHFQYHASVALIALTAATAVTLAARLQERARAAPAFVAAAALLVLATLTFRHALVFKNVDTLYRDTIAKNPSSWIAHLNLGIHLFNQGQLDDGWQHAQEAMRLNSKDSRVHYNIGKMIVDQGEQRGFRPGELENAIAYFEEAIRLKSDWASPYSGLGIALTRTGKPDDALRNFNRALELNPNSVDAWHGAGMLLLDAGNFDKSTEAFERAVQLAPGRAEVHLGLAAALRGSGQLRRAVEEFTETLRLQPRQAEAWNALGATHANLGEIDQAVACFRNSLNVDPDSQQAKANLTRALDEQQQRIQRGVDEKTAPN